MMRQAHSGARRSLIGLLGMVVLVGMGEHLAERFLPLYLQELAPGTTAILAIGMLAGMDDLLSALYAFPGGYLSDRLGTKRALLLFNLLSGVGYLTVILIRSWCATCWWRGRPSVAPCCGVFHPDSP